MNACSDFHLESRGFCPTCGKESTFEAYNPWLRDHFLCTQCGSIPRERALMRVIEQFMPDWRERTVHESSPCMRGASLKLQNECGNYIASQFFHDDDLGTLVNGVRNENLEKLSFGDNSIDLHVTQDVMEHIFNPEQAFREIHRTLRPGGMHIFTVPLVQKLGPSRTRAFSAHGEIVHIEPEYYHGNPIGDGRALVTTDWGYDICQFIHTYTDSFTQVISIDDMSSGIRAEYIEVLVTVKPVGRVALESSAVVRRSA
ncbi:class I SAM-dependent methyltransferase [Pseudomonas multiresinivorans]|uniref:Class I SAM-dependent methyltransferase n=1 Tax=Pseudomonas multiresinivorans TaxID=95301 RepID=A0A7Z3BLD6_9PSED|nr:class I SAM-dependent methyltransferase [Pseudomonas multiresinivorans]QJP08936.1 class I SAM-dependent methyltransferase [Pseudomonas multiresinivorans]